MIIFEIHFYVCHFQIRLNFQLHPTALDSLCTIQTTASYNEKVHFFLRGNYCIVLSLLLAVVGQIL
jgi:hypothetical protein